jgi:hypothetical protein
MNRSSRLKKKASRDLLGKIIIIIAAAAIFVLFCAGFTSCNKPASQASAASGAGLQIKNIIDPLTENYFISINNNDYEKFIRDFDDSMKKAVTKDKFAELSLQIKNGIGDYTPNSLKLISIANEQGYTVAHYTLDFSKKNNVKIRMVFSKINNEYKISGQWFE